MDAKKKIEFAVHSTLKSTATFDFVVKTKFEDISEKKFKIFFASLLHS